MPIYDVDDVDDLDGAERCSSASEAWSEYWSTVQWTFSAVIGDCQWKWYGLQPCIDRHCLYHADTNI